MPYSHDPYAMSSTVLPYLTTISPVLIDPRVLRGPYAVCGTELGDLRWSGLRPRALRCVG
eukprot:2683815-Rhodomonas_salina.2